ncbi:hypothetical protein K435DRAFT_863779 [Dendrothele bispora CBS 962.96]|uniref:Uncharacterized protein n=1 Tax=Dendrothele bispora (strain CBS 962.96) TaxID=1314807 RepID=A0A4S8LNX2_DENBC|nr:hypothetical protein K435DRAFT_863779 [Dendrothele bispora CBS 962.96]
MSWNQYRHTRIEVRSDSDLQFCVSHDNVLPFCRLSIHLLQSQDRQDGSSPSNDGDQIDHNPQYRRSLLSWAIAVFSYTSATDVGDVLEILGDDEPGEEPDGTDIMNIPLRPIEVSDWELARSVVDPENIDELYEWIEDWC